MGSHRAYVGRLTIANGAAESNILLAKELMMARALVFESPSAYTGTISIEGSLDDAAEAADMKAIEVNGTAITLTADVIEQWDIGGVCAIRAVSSGNEAAERVINVYAILELGGC